MSIAETVADITPEWLTEVLREAGQPVTATGVSSTRIGTGQTGTTYRLEVEYAVGRSGPERFVAKLAAEDPSLRPSSAFGYQQELRYYQHVASTVAVRAPGCTYSALSADGNTFTLLLEDLAPAVPGVQVEGCSVGQAVAALRNLAGLHAPRWGDPGLLDLGLLDYTTAADFMGPFQVDATEKFVAQYVGSLSAEDVETLREVARAATSFLRTRTTPYSVLHGDYRLDNLMFHPNGEDVIALDWQTLSVGPAARDVAYFLGTCLDPDVRRNNEVSLVRGYHAELERRGVADYTRDACFEDYRLGQLWAPMITTIGSMNAAGERGTDTDQMFVAMARRACTAIRDLGSLNLVLK